MLLWQWRESGNCNNVSMSNHNDACSVPFPDLNDKRCSKNISKMMEKNTKMIYSNDIIFYSFIHSRFPIFSNNQQS